MGRTTSFISRHDWPRMKWLGWLSRTSCIWRAQISTKIATSGLHGNSQYIHILAVLVPSPMDLLSGRSVGTRVEW